MAKVIVTLFGGLELLTKIPQRTHELQFEDGTESVTVEEVYKKLRDDIFPRSTFHHLFSDPESLELKAGIIVLVNDQDLQLCADMPLKDGDVVMLLSTLHGG
eukprot:Blabericola_migrator_1__2388@NODE_166_length_12211_cov_61_370142_g144_i0_p10_GENE_NODE_166_length_12211_cov_61_370142_g144_i0NODE_166_length_12211_cov_61_370142_g144_i0_p10_ORF_typecomplete_len102_score16_35Urm1/PF09138_11/7_8e18ThiS/PF02597_20/0_0003MTH865/PF07747_11/0_059_NODE_166_length_12211_cov_61_370142_g144_i085048809